MLLMEVILPAVAAVAAGMAAAPELAAMAGLALAVVALVLFMLLAMLIANCQLPIILPPHLQLLLICLSPILHVVVLLKLVTKTMVTQG